MVLQQLMLAGKPEKDAQKCQSGIACTTSSSRKGGSFCVCMQQNELRAFRCLVMQTVSFMAMLVADMELADV